MRAVLGDLWGELKDCGRILMASALVSVFLAAPCKLTDTESAQYGGCPVGRTQGVGAALVVRTIIVTSLSSLL